jgi:hypothetical protein
MNSATWVKFLAGVLLFGAWLALVLMRIVPPGPLVDAIGYALVGLGIYHASANGTSVSPLLASLLARVTPVDDPARSEPTQMTVGISATAPQAPAAASQPAPIQTAASPAGTLQ